MDEELVQVWGLGRILGRCLRCSLILILERCCLCFEMCCHFHWGSYEAIQVLRCSPIPQCLHSPIPRSPLGVLVVVGTVFFSFSSVLALLVPV